MKRIYLSQPHLSGKEEKFIKEALESNWITSMGHQLDAFEAELKNYIGAKNVVALSSGTAAIHLGLKALGVKKGDVVLCSSFTFIGSCNPILYEGAIPAFVDSEEKSWNICPIALKNAIRQLKKQNSRIAALVMVDLYGQAADYDRIKDICDAENIPILQDAAEGLGAEYKNQKLGSYADIAAFSFNGNKIITTSGGGAIATSRKDWAEKIRFWSTQAREKALHYEHTEIGYNYRMSNILAAVGRAQLEVLDDRVQARRAVRKNYEEAFASIDGIEPMPEADFGKSNAWLSVMRVNKEKLGLSYQDLIEELLKFNIESRPAWKPMHRQPLFRSADYFTRLPDISVCDKIYDEGLCLPSSSSLKESEQAQVISIIQDRVLRKRRAS